MNYEVWIWWSVNPPGALWFMRGQHQREPGWGRKKKREREREVAVDNSLSYFFFSVIYGNACRQSGAMNGIWWTQGYRANTQPPVMKQDLLTQEQAVKCAAVLLDYCITSKAAHRRNPKIKPFIMGDSRHFCWPVEVTTVYQSCWRADVQGRLPPKRIHCVFTHCQGWVFRRCSRRNVQNQDRRQQPVSHQWICYTAAGSKEGEEGNIPGGILSCCMKNCLCLQSSQCQQGEKSAPVKSQYLRKRKLYTWLGKYRGSS